MNILNKIIVNFKNIKSRFTLVDQYCKSCGMDQPIVWVVSDDEWHKLPKQWHNKTLCLECYCKLTKEKPNTLNILGVV